MAYPLLISLANIDPAIHSKISLHMYLLLALLPIPKFTHKDTRCKVAPESWGIGGSKMVSSRGLEGYEMFDPRDSRREDKEEENA